MLDNPKKTEPLLAAPKAAVPFEVELIPALIKHLQSEKRHSGRHRLPTTEQLAQFGISAPARRSPRGRKAGRQALTQT